MSLRSRIVKSFGAVAFGQGVSMVTQVIGVPLFLKAWGIDLYGEWLLLSSIPAYFAMSDMGFASVAGTEMAMCVARDDRNAALDAFQSTWAMVTGVSLLILLIISPTIWFLPLNQWLKLAMETPREVGLIVIMLTLQVLLGLQTAVVAAAFRSDGKNAFAMLYTSIGRLVEFLVLIGVLAVGGRPLALAAAVMVTRLVSLIIFRFCLQMRSPWITFGFSHAKFATIKKLASPALAYMGFPAGQALKNQGIVFVIGLWLGPAAVVVFSTFRTLANMVYQIPASVCIAFGPEMSFAFGANNMDLARNLHRRACQVSFWLVLIAAGGLLVCSPWLMRVWTHGRILLDFSLFAILLGDNIINAIWQTSSMVPGAVNRHQRMAMWFVISTGGSVLLAVLLVPMLKLNGAALSLLLIEIVMAVYVVRVAINWLQENFAELTRSTLRPPDLRLLLHTLQRKKM